MSPMKSDPRAIFIRALVQYTQPLTSRFVLSTKTRKLHSYENQTVVQASWNVMTHAQKSDFVFRRNGRVHLNRQGTSVQSTIGSRCVRISGSNAGYNMFRGSVKGTGYPLHSPFPPSLPLPASPCAITFQLDSNTREAGQWCTGGPARLLNEALNHKGIWRNGGKTPRINLGSGMRWVTLGLILVIQLIPVPRSLCPVL